MYVAHFAFSYRTAAMDGDIDDPDALRSVLAPYPDDAMDAHEVSTLVNAAANDGPEVIAKAV